MNKQDFDELLNDVLQQDAQIEPLAGLDERIMRRVITPPPQRSRRPFFLWACAAAMPICLVLAVVVYQQAALLTNTGIAVAVPSTQPQLLPEALKPDTQFAPLPRDAVHTSSLKLPKSLQPRQSHAETGKLRKLDVFPTPSDLPEPIRQLAVLSTRPETTIQGVRASDSQGKPPAKLKIEPLTIAAIEIKPLFEPPAQEQDKPQDIKQSPKEK